VDVKGTSGRQGHSLIFFPYFFGTQIYCTLLDLPILVACRTKAACSELELLSLTVRSPANQPESDTARHTHPYVLHSYIFSLPACLPADRRRKKNKATLCHFLDSNWSYIFYSLYSIYYTARWGNDCVHFQSMGLSLILFHPSPSDSTCSTVISSK
jgi:hypothetical protein